MRKAAPPKPHLRAGVWYLVRRVPSDFAQLDRRGIVRMTTGIALADDPKGIQARRKVVELDRELEIYWRGLLDGQSAEQRIRFDAATKRARQIGLNYQTAQELSEGAMSTILQRLDVLVARNLVESETDVAAVLGGENRPALKLSGLVDEFFTLQASSHAKKSEDQQRRAKNAKTRAVNDLIEEIGDKRLNEITRADAMQFRKWWQDRIKVEKLDIGTANKAFGHIKKMIGTIDMAHQLGLKSVFANLVIEGAKEKQRAPFEAEFVQTKILAAGALDGLNDEARDILHVVADTGMRPVEVANLLPEHIRLDDPIPHLQVRPVGRVLKTDQSERDVPLVGIALAAMERHKNGFPRYLDKSASLSGLVNKILKKRKLLPTDDHSFYSLRHTFEDRLTAIEAPEKVIASLMGHKWMRPKYGAGPSLKQMHEWMSKIAFKPPGHA